MDTVEKENCFGKVSTHIAFALDSIFIRGQVHRVTARSCKLIKLRDSIRAAQVNDSPFLKTTIKHATRLLYSFIDLSTQLEHLPNELFIDIFGYINIKDLYHGLWGLSFRINRLLQSFDRLSYTVETINQPMMSVFSNQIVRLVINTEDTIDMSLFPNLRSLTLSKGTQAQLSEIRTKPMPKLVYLSLSMPFYYSSPNPTADGTENNRLPSTQYPNLTRLDMIYNDPWSLKWCPHSVSLECSDPIVVQFIINLCPQLHRLQVNTYRLPHTSSIPSTQLGLVRDGHPLKELILSDSAGVFSLEEVISLLARTSHEEYVNLTLYSISFIDLAHNLSTRLLDLRRFDCHIIDLSANNESVDIETIHRIHPCFNRVQLKTNHHSGGTKSTAYWTKTQ